jgi:hypothetical protein
MEKAGVKDQKIFPADLLNEIHLRTQGIARLINAVCDNLLLTAFAMESQTANLAMLDEVSADLRLDWPGRRRPQRSGYQEETLQPTPQLYRAD